MANEIVLYDSPEAAKFVEGIKGWVSKDGFFFGDKPESEHIARYAGCTHRACDTCGKPTVKHYLICEECQAKKRDEEWAKMEKREWDGKALLCEFDGDTYYNDPDEALERIHDDGFVGEIRLVICEPVHLEEIDPNDQYAEYLPEDMEFDDAADDAVVEAFKKLNEAIRAASPISWTPGKFALDIALYTPKE